MEGTIPIGPVSLASPIVGGAVATASHIEQEEGQLELDLFTEPAAEPEAPAANEGNASPNTEAPPEAGASGSAEPAAEPATGAAQQP